MSEANIKVADKPKTRIEHLFDLQNHLEARLGKVKAAIKMFQDDPELEKKLGVLENLAQN